MANVKIEDYQERRIELAGWPVNLTSYRMGREWHCKADNVSPGAALCRTTGETRDNASARQFSAPNNCWRAPSGTRSDNGGPRYRSLTVAARLDYGNDALGIALVVDAERIRGRSAVAAGGRSGDPLAGSSGPARRTRAEVAKEQRRVACEGWGAACWRSRIRTASGRAVSTRRNSAPLLTRCCFLAYGAAAGESRRARGRGRAARPRPVRR